MSPSSKNLARLAVVTGGHPYDVVNFHGLFGSMAKSFEILIQHMDDFASSPKEVRQGYDVVLFYIMLMETPATEGLPWYSGQPKTALEELGETAQGIVVLHHAILAYPKWPVWNNIVGIQNRQFGYHVGQNIHVEIADATHPITRGMKAWDMTDETYTMDDAGADSRILLTVQHPKSMKAVAWTRSYRQARVFCFQSGHDNATWPNASFRKVLKRGILWASGRT